MAVTMATMNVVAVASPATAVKSSFRGQRLNAGQRGVRVAARRSVFVVRAEDKGVGKNVGSKIANQAEDLKDQLFGVGKGAQKEARNVLDDVQNEPSQLDQPANTLGGLGGLRGEVGAIGGLLGGATNGVADGVGGLTNDLVHGLSDITDGVADGLAGLTNDLVDGGSRPY